MYRYPEIQQVLGPGNWGFSKASSIANNFARGTQFLNRWTELLYLIFPNSSTANKYNIKLKLLASLSIWKRIKSLKHI